MNNRYCTGLDHVSYSLTRGSHSACHDVVTQPETSYREKDIILILHSVIRYHITAIISYPYIIKQQAHNSTEVLCPFELLARMTEVGFAYWSDS